MCVFLISPVPITKPLTSELIDTPVFYNLAPNRLIPSFGTHPYLFNVKYFDCYFFLSINLIHIKHRHDISVWNHSIIAQHVFTSYPLKVPHREIEFWIVFMFLYLFIHSFTYSYFFYYYLFVSLYLIYINQVWHFCFEIVQ